MVGSCLRLTNKNSIYFTTELSVFLNSIFIRYIIQTSLLCSLSLTSLKYAKYFIFNLMETETLGSLDAKVWHDANMCVQLWKDQRKTVKRISWCGTLHTYISKFDSMKKKMLTKWLHVVFSHFYSQKHHFYKKFEAQFFFS